VILGRIYPAHAGIGWRGYWWIREILLYFLYYLPGYLLCLLVFRLLNRTVTIGAPPRGLSEGYLVMSNHLSALDSWFIGHFFFPRPVWFPAKSELFRHRAVAWIISGWRAFPVRRGQHDQQGMDNMVELAQRFIVCIHPEGTRSRDGIIGRGRPGAGWIAHRARVPVVPVYIEGMDAFLPVGARFPRLGITLKIVFGEPFLLDQFAAMEPNPQVSQELIDEIIVRIKELQLDGRLRELASPAEHRRQQSSEDA